MKRILAVAALTALTLTLMSSAVFATQGDCTKYRNHSGHIPAQYDFGYGEEYVNGQLVDAFFVAGGQSAGPPVNGGTWDRVWKCHDTVTTTVPATTTTVVTTTTVQTTTTVTTLPPTTIPDTTTTVPPTTTVPDTTTTEPTTTTVPATTTTETTTTTQPETTTTAATTTTTVPTELPATGAPLALFGVLGVSALGLGGLALRAGRLSD